MNQPMYYGQRAYEGFANAFAYKVGVKVSLSGSSTSPHVDSSGVIHLPGLDKYQTKEEFEDTCATVIHEIAHVLYNSHTLFDSLSHKPRLWRDCLNAVLDIADETAVGSDQAKSGNLRAETLLVTACVHAGKQAGLHPNPHRGKPNTAPAHWRILSTGIIRARTLGNKLVKVGRAAAYGKWLIKEFPAIDIQGAFTMMSGSRGTAGRRHRERNLVTCADQLYTILESLAPPEESEETPMPGGAKVTQAAQKGEDQLPGGAAEATEQDGAAEADLDPSSAQGQPNPGGAGGQAPYDPYAIDTDRHCYDTMLPIVKRIANRLATDGEAISNEGGYMAGMGVKDAYRTITDGQCMGRWTLDPHADGMAVAVLLDCSASMTDILGQVAGVAEAFATGMEECARVQRWTFGDHAHPQDHFGRISTEGSTGTEDGLLKAREWLAGESAGQKLIVCVTDGQPNNGRATREQVALARSEGVGIIGVALGDCASHIAKTMPQATIVSAEDSNRLAIALEGITLQM